VNAPLPALEMRREVIIPAFLRKLTALVLVHFTAEGSVLDANLGFQRLVRRAGQEGAPVHMPDFLVNPRWQELVSLPALGDPPRVFAGILTLGASSALCVSLHAEVFRMGENYLLAAEHDLDEMERLGRAVLQVNEELAQTQRELARRNRELERIQNELAALARSDALTGLGNRRALEERLLVECERAERLAKPLAVILGDIDHFKQVNDRYGHAVGDTALRSFADLMRADVRPYDLVARYGGEEFVLLLPETSLAEAAEIAERIRLKLRAASAPGLPQKISASFGVCVRRRGEKGEQLLERADAALYMAKTAGRDRVVCAEH